MVSITKSPPKVGHEVASDATTGQALAIGLDVGNGAKKLYSRPRSSSTGELRSLS
jgi:hypothetical protein